MPRDNERISSNLETVVNRGACRLSRRSQNRNNHRLPSKEQSLSVLGLRNSEQRCTVLFVAVDHDSWKILVPMCVFHQVSEGRNQLGCEVDISLNRVESLEQRNSSPERPGSAELSTASSSSETSVLGKSNRRNWTRSDESGNILKITNSEFDFDNVVASCESVNSTLKKEKPVKKSSRKKGKKKRKQYKGSAQKSACVIAQYEEGISQELLEKVTSPSLLVRDTEENNITENSNDCRNNPARALTLKLYNDEMHNSEQVSSLHWESSGENLSCAHSGRFEILSDSMSSCSTISSVILSTSSEISPNVHPKQDAIYETSQISNSLEPNSFMDELKTETVGIFSDVENCSGASMKSTFHNKYACNSSEGPLTFNLMENSVPSHSITPDSCDKSSEISSYRSFDTPECSKCTVDTDRTNERVQCSSEASTSDGFHPVVYKKRGRLRKAYPSSNSLHISGTANLYGQKTQRNQTNRCIRGLRNDNFVQHVNVSSKGSEVWEKSDKGDERNQIESGALCSCPCSTERVIETAYMDTLRSVSSDIDPNGLSKVINKRLLHNSPLTLKEEPSSASNHEYLENEKIQVQEKAVEISIQKLKKNESQSSSHRTAECRSPDSDIFELGQSESIQNKQINTFEEQNEISPLLAESDFLENTSIKLHSNGGIMDTEDIQIMELGSESMLCDDRRKDLLVFDKNSSKVPNMNDPISDRLKWSKVKLELPISNFHHLVPSNDDEPFTSFDTDLCKIIQAIDESYKLLTASESIRMVTGSPLAEFERFVDLASPSINQTIGDAFCTHQVPKGFLGNLWKWYEKPGSYGLEVKVEDHHNSKRSPKRCSQFRAYFVPYLSAIQLFARSRSFVCLDSGVCNRVAKEFNNEDTPKSSVSLESLPIFSKLLPRPPKKIVPSDKDEVCCQIINSSDFTDEELLFEYFEVDQPHQRRPLFEKIKELARGEVSSNCQIFGDSSNLECLNFHELHPASWFSVAWYPIYRIPDGNFRAAFLTYHSLGRFLHRGTSSNVIGDVNQIVSPIVGMQTYNDKGECWFAQRSFMTEKTMSTNPSGILNKRLHTLENAASVMARAAVRKGNQKSVNKHPDYEFFLSRRR
ncbi:uncharacterized protein A4U43_C04F31100 [Asparagus officinalis]|uniref:Uncharacterized protein n=1 Tax=Asparagus officinalis TaxID=4686 RepID=A0A5P1F9T3_ASPOF|nr:uncharacterized protein LOC109838730 [Asparagus officinalis]XP_020262742.1 uncharacterized protein LOC109838730 [Asparagus officinalis]ONK73401.1 uncharacterized protein A4U43_C04F31100 [Asparagus officinalis]